MCKSEYKLMTASFELSEDGQGLVTEVLGPTYIFDLVQFSFFLFLSIQFFSRFIER